MLSMIWLAHQRASGLVCAVTVLMYCYVVIDNAGISIMSQSGVLDVCSILLG